MKWFLAAALTLAAIPALAQGIPANGICSANAVDHTGEAAWHAFCSGQYVGIPLDNFGHLGEFLRATRYLDDRVGFRYSFSGDYVSCNPDACGGLSQVPRIQNIRPGTQN